MEVRIGTTPNGRPIIHDTGTGAFKGQPVGDDIFIERASLKVLLADIGWRPEEIDWDGGQPGRPRDPKAEDAADAEASRLYDLARREFPEAWAKAKAEGEADDDGLDGDPADGFIDTLADHWGEYPSDPVVQEKLHEHIHGGLS